MALGFRRALPYSAAIAPRSQTETPQGRPLSRENRSRQGSRAENDRGHRTDDRGRPEYVGQELVDRLIFGARHRRLDRRNVSYFSAGSSRRSANSRLRRAEGLRHHLPQRKHSEADGLLRVRRALRPYRTVASWYMWRAVQLAGPRPAKSQKPSQSPRNAFSAKRRIVLEKRALKENVKCPTIVPVASRYIGWRSATPSRRAYCAMPRSLSNPARELTDIPRPCRGFPYPKCYVSGFLWFIPLDTNRTVRTRHQTDYQHSTLQIDRNPVQLVEFRCAWIASRSRFDRSLPAPAIHPFVVITIRCDAASA